MKKAHKDEIRLFILERLYASAGLRETLNDLAATDDYCPFEAMEFYENEVERINKLFNYPAQ
jgi:hypothetical protein